VCFREKTSESTVQQVSKKGVGQRVSSTMEKFENKGGGQRRAETRKKGDLRTNWGKNFQTYMQKWAELWNRDGDSQEGCVGGPAGGGRSCGKN